MNPKFQVGDVVDWELTYLDETKCRHYLQDYEAGPFEVIRAGRSLSHTAEWVVSVRRWLDGYEPRHNGSTEQGRPAPYGGNNWDERFFTKDPFLTAVRQRGLCRDTSKLETARRVPED